MIYVNDVLIFFYSLTFLYDVIFFLLLFINLLLFFYIYKNSSKNFITQLEN